MIKKKLIKKADTSFNQQQWFVLVAMKIFFILALRQWSIIYDTNLFSWVTRLLRISFTTAAAAHELRSHVTMLLTLLSVFSKLILHEEKSCYQNNETVFFSRDCESFGLSDQSICLVATFSKSSSSVLTFEGFLQDVNTIQLVVEFCNFLIGILRKLYFSEIRSFS